MPRVLIVSADADFRAVASRVLARAGHQVIAVPHAGHALLACIQQPALNVLLINETGADGDAAAVARRLRRYCRDLRVVCMLDRRGPTRGDASLVRPFTADHLLAAVAAAFSATASETDRRLSGR